MSTIVTRAGKGSALTWAEADANFTNLNTDKLEATDRPYSDTNPIMDSTAAQGTSPKISRQDHVHPSDTSKVNKSGDTMTGTLKTTKVQFGVSGTTTNNFIFDPSAADGTILFERESGPDIFTVRANGETVFHHPFGYALGGGSVTQLTDKTTGVTLDQRSGLITTSNSSLTAGQVVRFTLTNSLIALNDLVLVQRRDGGTGTSYRVWTDFSTTGSAGICIQNITASPLGEAIVISFSIIKGAGA